jgi:hypothetical protein
MRARDFCAGQALKRFAGPAGSDDDRIQAQGWFTGQGNKIARGGTIFPSHAIVRNAAD